MPDRIWAGLELANAVYVSGWEERRVSLPVAAGRYETELRRRQKLETTG